MGLQRCCFWGSWRVAQKAAILLERARGFAGFRVLGCKQSHCLLSTWWVPCCGWVADGHLLCRSTFGYLLKWSRCILVAGCVLELELSVGSSP